MQTDSTQLSTSGHMIHNQTQESPVKSYPCSHCTLILKSKVYLFEHLNQEHGFDVDAALRDAGLKSPGTSKAGADDSSPGNNFECRHCDFKAGSLDVLSGHEKECPKIPDNRKMMGNLMTSENQETNQQEKAAGAKDVSSISSVKPTSKTKCTVNSSKDVKTYKRPLQTITKYLVMTNTGSKPLVKSPESPLLLGNSNETLLLQESPADSSPNSSGVFKVTATSTIDVTRKASHCFLLDDHLSSTDIRPAKAEEKLTETPPNNIGKRTSNSRSKSPPAKKAKSEKGQTAVQENANAGKQQPSSKSEFLFEFSDDEEEKRGVNGDMDGTQVYFCKQCDYSDVGVRRVSAHYQNNHPYLRFKAVYIQDPSDQSATYRCLECPVEFISAGNLKKHYAKNHPLAPNIFKMQSSELCLVFKCFLCPFTSDALKTLKEHYEDKHPTHKMDTSLMCCRYSALKYQEAAPSSSTCGKAASSEKLPGIPPESARTPCKEVKNATSPPHPTPKAAEVALYHCSRCEFSHKSVVVMHVHYQKSHPDEAVTIDKIKQFGQVASYKASQMAPVKSSKAVTVIEKSAPEGNISESSKEKVNEAARSQQEETSEPSKTPPKSAKTKKTESTKRKRTPSNRRIEKSPALDSPSCTSSNGLVYCQFCTYSSTNIKSVVGHHNAKHSAEHPADTEEILWYSAQVEKKKLQSKAKAAAKASSSKSKSGKQVAVSGERELQHAKYEAANASVLTDNVYAHAENLFYCQKCNYGNPSPYGVLNHQGKSHSKLKGSIEQVVEYTALIRDEIEKSKSQAKNLSYSGYLPLPLINKGEVDAFFCHFCNYRHSVLSLVLRHFVKQHRGVKASSERITQYTSMVHAQTQKSRLKTTPSQDVKPASLEKKDKKKKTKKLVKVSTSTLVTASQTERALQCHRCSYSTQNVNVLRRHMWKIHKANRSVAEVLKVCFNQGNLQTGYHCDMCVFSHSKASVVHKHYLEKHPLRKLSLENVSTRLYVSPETCSPKKKKPKTKHSDGISDSNKPDGSSPSQRSGHIDAKPYSCKACSFRGSSMSGLTRHYRAIHPWSVKEDGSVLDVTDSKRLSANKQVEDHVDVPVSFDSYQAPLEFENTPDEPDSSQQSASPKKMQCPYCSASFPTQRGLNTHCGMKHQDIVSESPRHPASRDRNQKEQMQARVHLFKCPHCTYINTNYHGVLTHCQMRHPNLVSRADSLYMDEADLNDWEDCVRSKGSDLKLCGYLCENCPQICASLEKLNKHCQEGHNETAANSEPKKSETDLKPSAVSKKRQPKLKTKAPFLNKVYSMMKCQFCLYHCTTKFALARHLQVRHKSVSVSKVLDSSYKCALCSNIYFKKKRLACHYAKKHGKEAFLKYYAPLYKQKRPAATDSDPENVSEPKSSITADDENRKSVFKCPNCPYVNASHHGMLTHCQMRHPDIVARAGKLQSCEILLSNMIGCTLGKGSNVRGYTCKKCPQIHVSLKKLKQHWQNDHDRTQTAAPKHSVEAKTEKEPVRCSVGSVLEAFSLKNTVPAESSTEAGLSDQLGTPETSESNTMSSPDKKLLYRCSICGYIGSCRKYLNVHYRNTHKLDSFTTSKMLERYNKRRPRYFPESKSEDSAEVKCKMCPDLTFDSSQLLIDHYSTSHRTVDFIVLSKGSRKSTGLYKCALCSKQLNGIRKLCIHMDRHNQIEKRRARAAEKKTASPVTSIVPEPKSIEFCRQDELPMLETVEDLAQWNVTPVETFILPQSPQSSPAKPTEPEQPEPELSEGESTCKQCGRTFMSRKGLRTHERSHAAMAAIKKQNNLSTSALKQDINKYVQYKVGTVRPFLCIFCSYRTTVLGLWRIHFMKKHQSVLLDSGEIENQDEERAGRADDESPRSSEEVNNLSEVDEEPEITERSLYLEPPDVQRQLNHYSMMAGAAAKVTVQETRLLDSVLHCEVCNFSTEHLSSIRRHYLNRHGKKMLRCKDCDFVTGLKKTLEMHMETGHSTSSSKATHQKDLHCPFCLYQTTNKNHMIDHIVLHREERVVPIQVCRPKLSRYLEGIVFRCHKCTFTSGSAENLRLHMMKHDDIKPYKCRLCYFDCTQLSDLEAHLSDKHQVLRNHELVGQISLDQLEARVGQTPEEEEEPLSDLEHHNDNGKDVKIEEFATDCNEVPHKTQARNSEEDNIREKITLEVKKAYQKHGQDGKNGQEEDLSKSHLLDHQYVHTTVQENYEVAEIAFLPNAAKRQEIESIAEDGQDSRVAITQQREEEAEGSSAAFRKLAEKIQAQKPNVKSLKHRTLNIEARVEDDILRQILLLDDDGSTCKIHKKADLDQTVKTEQEVVNNVLNEIQLLDGEGSNASPKKEVNPEATFASAMTNQRHPLTLGPSCGQIRMSHRGILTVSFTNCKEKQVENQKNCEAVRNLCEEMPELGNEYMQEDMKTPGCCKEEDENDHLVQKQNEGDEMIVEQEESRRTDREHQQGEGTKEDESPPVFKGAMTVTDETATEEKQFTCELCGRNLMSSSELERHIIRHGI